MALFGNTLNETGQMALSFEPERRIFRVSELNSSVQRLFERQFRSIWVAGEISGCRMATSGHYYFSLKDTESQIKCALFKGSARFTRFKPQDGLAVIVRGNLEVYEARGEYQLIIETIEPQGAGALQLAFEQLKQKLAAEGLFDAARKRPLPKLPHRIGIVTSPAGAVIRDILHILERRFKGLHLRIFPAQVQGEGSAEQVCRGIRYFSETGWAELIIVARGGGSLEDLWTFNEEVVARTIAASSVPLISAIGHETDFTIADFVADHRAPTPSAAAEIAVPTRESLLDQIATCRAKAAQSIRYRVLCCIREWHQRGPDRAAMLIHRLLTKRAQQVDELDHRIRSIKQIVFDSTSKRLADLTRRLQATDLRLKLASRREQRRILEERMLKAIQSRLWQVNRRYETAQVKLGQLSPLSVLSRGYAIVETKDGQVIRSASEASPGDSLQILLGQGGLDVLVQEVRREE